MFYYTVVGGGFALSQDEVGVTLQFLLAEPAAWIKTKQNSSSSFLEKTIGGLTANFTLFIFF